MAESIAVRRSFVHTPVGPLYRQGLAGDFGSWSDMRVKVALDLAAAAGEGSLQMPMSTT